MPNLIEQAPAIAACTPSDSTVFTKQTALYVGVGGTVVVKGWGNTATTTFLNVPSGTFMPIQVRQVYSTGTTATNILLLTNE